MKAPTYSHWGKVQGRHKLLNGVYWVSTPSHGGLMIHEESDVFKWLSPDTVAKGRYCQHGDYLGYEEDEAWAIPCFESTELRDQVQPLTKGDIVQAVFLTLSGSYPDILIANGIEPDPERYNHHLMWVESCRLREEKCPTFIVSALRANPEWVKVWTADDKEWYVKADEYHQAPYLKHINQMSTCVEYLPEEVK